MCAIEGWSIHTMLADLMHVLYIGCANDACGSAMFILCKLHYFSASRDDPTQLRKAHACLREWCRDNRVQCDIGAFDPLALGFGSKSFPYLETKAANLKVIVFWLAHELHHAAIAGHDEIKRAAAMFHALAEFVHVLSTGGQILSHSQADRVQHYGT
eukprot:15484547-Alexandrium_andersonii.AAC.1